MPEHATPTFIRIRTGLLAPKHIRKMGGGPWPLYLWLHTQVWFGGEHVGTTREPYTHERAAEALGAKVGSIRRWFADLHRCNYVATKQLRYGLDVTITNYQAEGRVSTSEQSGAQEPAPRVLINERQGVQISTPGCADLGIRVSTSEQAIYMESSRQVDKSRQVDDDAPRREVAAVDVLDRFNATLVGAKGYVPSSDFLLKVREKYGALDLEEIALSARDWCRAKRKDCSQRFLLNWLRREKAKKDEAEKAAPRATRPQRIEPPTLPSEISYPTPEERAERDKRLRQGSDGMAHRSVKDDPTTRAEAKQRLLASGKVTAEELERMSRIGHPGALA